MIKYAFAITLMLAPNASNAQAAIEDLAQQECRVFNYLDSTPSTDVTAGPRREAHIGMQLFYRGMIRGAQTAVAQDRAGLVDSELRSTCRSQTTLPFATALRNAIEAAR